MSIKHCPSYFNTGKEDHGFIDVYDTVFPAYRSKPITFVEIGVSVTRGHGGSSLWYWREYFQGKIFGVDIDPNASFFERPGIDILIGSQNDDAFLSSVVEKTGPIDILIDDGSHINTYTIKTFERLWPHIKSGGLYIIEDMHCSYEDLVAHRVSEHWPGMGYVPKQDIQNDRQDIDNFLTNTIHGIDAGNDIHSMQVFRNLLVFKKK